MDLKIFFESYVCEELKHLQTIFSKIIDCKEGICIDVLNVVDNEKMTPLILAINYQQEKLADLLVSCGCDTNKSGPQGETPLMLAAANGLLSVVKVLVYSDAEINALDKEDRNALIYAIINQNQVEADFLIEQKININLSDTHGYTPLMYAVLFENSELIETLIKNGADINAIGLDNKTAIHVAIEEKQRDTSKLLLKFGANKNHLDKNQRTPLIKAIALRQDDLVSELVTDENVNKADINGNSPIIIAAAMGNITAVEKLVKLKANPYLKNKDNLDAVTVCSNIDEALKNKESFLVKGITEILKTEETMINGEVLKGDQDGETVIVAGDNFLLSDEDPIRISDKGLHQEDDQTTKLSGMTGVVDNEAIMVKGRGEGNIESEEVLKISDLERELLGEGILTTVGDHLEVDNTVYVVKDDPNSQGHDPDANEIIRIRDTQKYNDIHSILTKVTSSKTSLGQTTPSNVPNPPVDDLAQLNPDIPTVPLDESITGGQKFDDFNPDVMFAKKKLPNGQNLLMYAASKGAMNLMTKLLQFIDVNAKDFFGYTAMTYAASAGLLPAVELLYKGGAKMDEKGTTTITPLAWAIIKEHLDVAQFLLGVGANPNYKIRGQSLLVIAILRKNLELVKLLCKHGADVTKRDHRNLSAYDYAREKGTADIVKFLEGTLKERQRNNEITK
ncbi:MAG: ankyrin repeat domain-containing protein [Oligoflexia bacterium]|nr:ankyrin repeat domain-containing protein [Oligoflexia bacterium]